MTSCIENTHNKQQREHYSGRYARTMLESKRDLNLWNGCKKCPLMLLSPFVQTLNGSSCLVVCAGQGLEIEYLHSQGLIVTATDLVVEHLRPLLREGVVTQVAVQDAEDLTYDPEGFDWGIVNAGLRHLEHPHLGLYELLRRARKGVLFLESQDLIPHTLARKLGISHTDFEPAGNRVYRWKTPEIEKICLSAHLHSFAIKTYFLPIQAWIRHVVGFWKKLAEVLLKAANIVLSTAGNGILVIIFKDSPNLEQVAVLRRSGFHFIFAIIYTRCDQTASFNK